MTTPDERRGRRRAHSREAEPPTDLTDAEREALDAVTDPLIDLVAYVERHRPTPTAYDDPRFLAWLSKEGRMHPRERAAREAAASGVLSEAELADIAQRVRATVEARRLGVG